MSWWVLAPAVAALVLAPFLWRPLWRLATTVSSEDRPVVRHSPSSPLGFTATHEGSDWKLVWNREALAKLDALGAMLTISDGGVGRMQFLSSRDLAAGAVVYVPRTSDLTFNLKVTVPNAPEIEEQVRILGADQQSDADIALPPRRIFGEASRSEIQPPPTAAAAKPTPKPFQPPPVPLVSEAPSSAPAVSLPEVHLPSPVAPRIAAIARTTAPPLPPLSNPAPILTPAPVRPAPIVAPTVRVDPSPLRTVVASWPANTARVGTFDIQIHVQIDPKGRVVGATPLERNVRNFAFVDAALTAARLWTFAPATENGHPVASQSVLTFKFRP